MAATFVLDTDVCIDLIRGQVPAEGFESNRVPVAASIISSVTLAELEVGVAKAPAPSRPRRQLDDFLEQVLVVDFDAAAAHHYGEIRAHLEKKGNTIGPLDLLIAAMLGAAAPVWLQRTCRSFAASPG